MRRKSTKNTRGPNADEKRFQSWIKEQPCWYCGNSPPSIADHARGATFKHNKVLIGHWLQTPKCQQCDDVKTLGNHNWHLERLGITESQAWLDHYQESPWKPPVEVVEAIRDFGK